MAAVLWEVLLLRSVSITQGCLCPGMELDFGKTTLLIWLEEGYFTPKAPQERKQASGDNSPFTFLWAKGRAWHSCDFLFFFNFYFGTEAWKNRWKLSFQWLKTLLTTRCDVTACLQHPINLCKQGTGPIFSWQLSSYVSTAKNRMSRGSGNTSIPKPPMLTNGDYARRPNSGHGFCWNCQRWDPWVDKLCSETCPLGKKKAFLVGWWELQYSEGLRFGAGLLS